MYMISPENIKNTENEFLYFLLFLAFMVVKTFMTLIICRSNLRQKKQMIYNKTMATDDKVI